MKIGIDCQHLLLPRLGPVVYLFNLIKALTFIDKTNQYTLYFTEEPTLNVIRQLNLPLDNFKIKVLKSKTSFTQITLALELLKNPVDIMFCPVHTIPLIKNPKQKIVAMIHGLEFKTNKNNTGSLLFKIFKGWHEWVVAKYSNHIIVPSQATKNAILNQNWKITTQKLTVIHEGVDNEFLEPYLDNQQQTLDKYNLQKHKYFIAVSTIQPRKNYEKLIEAFSIFLKENKDLNFYKLVICGKNGWNYEQVLKAPYKHKIQDNVIFTEHISNEDLINLLANSKCYVSASLDEGFGLPVVEALSLGIDCIVSDIEVYKEICQDFCFYFNPNDVNQMAEAFYYYSNKKPSPEHREKLKNYAKTFSWKNTAQKTLETFATII